MEWFLWMLGVAILGLAAVASSGRLGELPPPVSSAPAPHVPLGDLTGDDLRAARFSVVPRGYSMAQVDDLLDRLAHQLDAARPASGRHSEALTRSPPTEVGAQSSSEAEGRSEGGHAPERGGLR